MTDLIGESGQEVREIFTNSHVKNAANRKTMMSAKAFLLVFPRSENMFPFTSTVLTHCTAKLEDQLCVSISTPLRAGRFPPVMIFWMLTIKIKIIERAATKTTGLSNISINVDILSHLPIPLSPSPPTERENTFAKTTNGPMMMKSWRKLILSRFATQISAIITV